MRHSLAVICTVLVATACGRDARPPVAVAVPPESDRRWIQVCHHVERDPEACRVARALERAGIPCYAQGSLNSNSYFVPFADRARAVDVLATDPTTADVWIMDEAEARIEDGMWAPSELPKR